MGKRLMNRRLEDAVQDENKTVCKDLTFYLHQSTDFRNRGYVVNLIVYESRICEPPNGASMFNRKPNYTELVLSPSSHMCNG
jgi:hypothetical protein